MIDLHDLVLRWDGRKQTGTYAEKFEEEEGGVQTAADVRVNFHSASPLLLAGLTEDATMKEEDGDLYPETKRFSLWPLPRFRSYSDVSGFRSRVLFRLRGARSGMRMPRYEPQLSCTTNGNSV